MSQFLPTIALSWTLLVLPCHGQEPAPSVPALRAALDGARGRLAEHLGGVQVSAFGDALWALDDQGRRQVWADALEVDYAGALGRTLEMAGAVTRTGGVTHLPVGFLDFHPFGAQLAPRGQLSVEKGFHIQAGRFDVPYGNDFQSYASKDSLTLSRPWTTTAIMDGGYNDEGLRLLGNNGTVNFNAFLLRGFLPGRLLGGRLGLTPFSDPFSLSATRQPKVAEVGCSWYRDVTSDWRPQETGTALDADARLGPYYFRAEYLVRKRSGGAGEAFARRGWHCTQELALGAVAGCATTWFVRLERLAAQGPLPPASGGEDHDSRWVTGVNLQAAGVFILKVEVQREGSATAATRLSPGFNPTLWLAQLVVVL